MQIRCAACKKVKPEREFHRNRARSNGRKSYCKACISSPANRAKSRQRMAEWRSNPENYAKLRARVRDRRYGLKPGEYDALVTEQGGLCAICKKPPSGKRTRLAVDHDHKTGAIRGLLCDGCNNGLARFKDNPRLMKEAVMYIIRHRRTVA